MGNSVPKEMRQYYDVIGQIITVFCEKYLDKEYEELCLKALAKLCRKRPSPLLKGRPYTWAAGIVYAVGTANFIFDRANKYYISAADLADAFEVSKSTASSKAAEIKKMLKIDVFNGEWIVPSEMESNPMIWMVEVNGLAMDARRLPLEYQQICYEKGLIPYVPALKEKD
ncbi:DUF6398 domain-containing protein [Butyrivibrio sp. INlla14]|uniref:DUF6398 domain-containing protein n=1 Tax=Butyrivibrio sp. INlla14 TaxID=1520808 RepID=UPI0008767DEE|nr:DUF6398 domain-containing protein [Butyrivibrio sp. INlla14]SCY14412.1 hypothetical protein SAMN02910371_01205 [Butyrivibrio sp. INlla14]